MKIRSSLSEKLLYHNQFNLIKEKQPIKSLLVEIMLYAMLSYGLLWYDE